MSATREYPNEIYQPDRVYMKPIRKELRCDCGRDVVLSGFTNACACGREYNMSGQARKH